MLEGGVPRIGRVTQAEGLECRVAQAALLVQVVQGQFSSRRVDQLVAVESHRLFQQGAQAFVLFFFFRLLRPVGFQLDPGALGQGTQRFAEIPAFLLHHEGDDIAALAALPEAAPGLPVGRDNERGRLLGVEGAQAGEVLPGAAQLDRFGDQVNDVNAGFDFVYLGHGVEVSGRQVHKFR